MSNSYKTPVSKVIKTILCGSPGVGKTTLRDALFGKDAKYEFILGSGVELDKKIIKFDEMIITHNGYRIRNLIWRLVEDLELKWIKKFYFKRAKIGIFVYDCSRPKTLSDLKEWMKVYLEQCQFESNELILALVENKKDLKSAISYETVDKFLSTIKDEFSLDSDQIKFYQTSAVTNEGVQRVFNETVELILERFTY